MSMGKRPLIAASMAAGMLWSIGLLWVGAAVVNVPVFALVPTVFSAFLAPGLVTVAMVGRLAQRRFFDDQIIDGDAFVAGSAAEIDQRVLTNTVEQLVLALCIWPAAAVILAGDGPGVIIMLGLGFSIARILFWIGYHLSPPLRGFGFAATFYPPLMAFVWAVLWWLL